MKIFELIEILLLKMFHCFEFLEFFQHKRVGIHPGRLCVAEYHVCRVKQESELRNTNILELVSMKIIAFFRLLNHLGE